jgi:hypothetical protein
MRSLTARCALAALLGLGVAAAEDAPKHELIYRWDQLDGKTATYDTELDAFTTTERKSTTEQLDARDTEDPGDIKTEIVTTTKQRLSMSFKSGEGGRGLVTIKNVRFQQQLTQKMLGETKVVTYDSANPPKAGSLPGMDAEKLKALEKPYTLTVSRRGVVEKADGRPQSDLDQLKKTFLRFPDVACTVSQSWNEVRRHPTPPLGDLVERFQFKLAAVGEKDERRIEQRVETELDDRLTRDALRQQNTVVRIEKPTGKGHLVFDPRGLRLEAATEQGYELYIHQVTQGIEHRTKYSERMTWKLVEVK